MTGHRIDTAPRDGSRIMVFLSPHWHFARWSDHADYGFGETPGPGWQVWECDDHYYSWAIKPDEPTYWQAEPPEPQCSETIMTASARKFTRKDTTP